MGILSSMNNPFVIPLSNNSTFRYVSRNSYSSISPFRYTPKPDSHSNNGKLLLKRLSGNTDGIHYFSTLSTDKGSKNLLPIIHNNLSLPFHKIRPYLVSVVGSCNGLVCLMDDNMEGKAVLWNPWTREFKFLPESSVQRQPSAAFTEFYSCGFGFDPKSQDYKVVRFVVHYFEDKDGDFCYADHHAELYSLKSDSWKEIPDPKMSPWSYSSAYVNGCYYWVASSETVYDLILSFDFANEEFSSLPFPETTQPEETRHLKIFEFDGSLAAIVYPWLKIEEKSCELWVMNEGSWTIVSVIHVSGVEEPLGFWGNDKLFFEGMDRQLLLYDCATQELKNLSIYDYPGTMHLVPYVENSAPLNEKSA